jgi:predicted nucleic acid-binding protein
VIFWDTSAFARAFLENDPGYGQARSLLTADARHAGSTLLWPETASALSRQARSRGAKRGFDVEAVRQFLERLELVEFGSDLATRALDLVIRHHLLGADAAHLATALDLSRRSGRRGFRFACSDRELATAARSQGLRVVSPGL